MTNAGKKYYLKLAAEVFRKVKKERDKDGVFYTRRAMIGFGMALNLNRRSEIQQLFPLLQEIVAEFPDDFKISTGHPLQTVWSSMEQFLRARMTERTTKSDV